MSDVVIWHIGRCGSTVLGSLLNQHPAIQWENEILRPYLLAKRSGHRIPSMDQVIMDVAARKSKAIQAVEVKFLECQHPGIFGATLEETIEAFLARGYCRFIILHRANYLRRMVSHCVAQATDRYFVHDGEDAAAPHRITMDVNAIRIGSEIKSLLAWFEIFADAYRHIEDSLRGYPMCTVSYEEDIEQNPSIGYAKACRFLGLEPLPARVSYQRTNPFCLVDILHNYEEVADLLARTSHAWMLMERETIAPALTHRL